ncbi:CPBP family intramembrane glutamic endopeptidase [Algicella marina]|uniref:CPBP family intramembrane metalloprotease n=1 Tax=Algicella marina TaxID=2683284 RepID=A0A6P1T573_9RHOB|nr:CPBP family intramembrane glutamic endopeptidase [Algicella marina]QHQ36870.1 CPBP family intramembrane metalloprotease [Algicella marina]
MAEFRAQSAARFGRTPVWRIILGTGIAGGTYVVLTILAFVALGVVYMIFDPARLAQFQAGVIDRLSLLVLLAAFAGVHLGVLVAGLVLHGKPYRAFWGQLPAFRPRAFALGTCLILLTLSVLILPAIFISPPVPQVPLPTWLSFLPFVLIVLLVQTSAEELLFRGYLQPLLASRFNSRLVWLLLPAFLFGALHWKPDPYGPNAAIVVIAATLMGLIAGDVTARTGNISAAFGLHFGNNCVGLLFLATPGDLSAFGLYLTPIGPEDVQATRIGLIANVVLMGLAYGLWRLFLRRRARLLSGDGPTI